MVMAKTLEKRHRMLSRMLGTLQKKSWHMKKGKTMIWIEINPRTSQINQVEVGLPAMVLVRLNQVVLNQLLIKIKSIQMWKIILTH